MGKVYGKCQEAPSKHHRSIVVNLAILAHIPTHLRWPNSPSLVATYQTKPYTNSYDVLQLFQATLGILEAAHCGVFHIYQSISRSPSHEFMKLSIIVVIIYLPWEKELKFSVLRQPAARMLAASASSASASFFWSQTSDLAFALRHHRQPSWL